jgi:cyclopropane fatty-acyl-phospholipid synthase-like methyltransferase
MPMIERKTFEDMYQGQAPWDIGKPQPVFIELEESGAIRGSVLDVGCGTGEHVMYLAIRGHDCWGIDFVPVAIERARAKADQRGVPAHFQVADALELDKLGRQFDTVIDSGLFHVFDDEQRSRFVKSLAAVLKLGGTYYMACFSEREPGTEGPRRVTQQEIRDAFRDGWEVQSIRETKFATRPDGPQFSPGGPHAWLATITRRPT